MNKNSIIAISSGLLDSSELALKFTALEKCMLDASSAKAILKETTGNLCEAPEFIPCKVERWTVPQHEEYANARLINERLQERDNRRIIFYAARLRVHKAAQALKLSRQQLIVSAEAFRSCIEQSTIEQCDPLELDVGRVNLFFSNQLAFDAYKLFHEMRQSLSHGVGISDYQALGNKIDLAAVLNAEYVRSERVYAVKYSGHCSQYRFDGPDPDSPPAGPLLTFDEARRDAVRWEGLADTIGGGAILYNVRTQTTDSDYRDKR